MRTFGSPKTPRTTGSARNPSNEYVSQSRRRRFDILAIQHLCQILNPTKMQNIPEIPRSMTLQALKFTHSIPRRPFFKGDSVAIEKTPERATAGSNPSLAQLCDGLHQSQVRLLGNQIEYLLRKLF